MIYAIINSGGLKMEASAYRPLYRHIGPYSIRQLILTLTVTLNLNLNLSLFLPKKLHLSHP